MNAIREIVKSVNNKIIIELPENYQEENEYEVIVLPAYEKGSSKKSRKDLYGKYKGQIWISDDFNEPLEDFKEYME